MNLASSPFNWSDIAAVIFDVDGTLYNQRFMRRLILGELLRFYALRPWRLAELKIILDFRAEREKRVHEEPENLKNAQYQWAAGRSKVGEDQVRRITSRWIHEVPLKYLKRCRYPGVAGFCDTLAQRGFAMAVYSDYPAREKIAALELPIATIVSSTDSDVNRLKPHPRGLIVVSNKLGLSQRQCLFIGDRDDRDGECARRAGMPYLILNKKAGSRNNSFSSFVQLEKCLVQQSGQRK